MKRFFTVALLLLPGFVLAQTVVTGTVTDANNEPLVGAVVRVANTYTGVFTDLDGSYELTLRKPGEYTLQAEFLGFTPSQFIVQAKDVPATVQADVKLEPSSVLVDEIVVSATRAGQNTPVAQTTMTQEDIAKQNLGQDMPYVLRMQPSVVVTSDAGTGVGYTGIRIRGSDATRVNVTINGIPYNDAESQGVFWVDLPDIATSTESVQIQRGVGTSTNGAGAFGGTVNVNTTKLNAKPYAQTSHTYGSFNTRKHNASFGTGLINNHWTVDGRLSHISSDGYVDRATADLSSYFLSGAFTGKRTSVRANIFSGHEITYQSWYGIPKDSLVTNRTYNPYTYENEVDDYTQTHYQLLVSHQLNPTLNLNAALFYTRGFGFFENYEYGESVTSFGIDPVMINDSVSITNSDLIQRRWLDNHFYGATWSANYNANGRLTATLGGSLTQYDGKHFGEVIWARYAGNTEIRHRYYDNDGFKTDFNIYAKANYQLTAALNAFVDVQYRMVDYSFLGFDADAQQVDQDVQLSFVNPKAGLTYRMGEHNTLYTSFAVGNKEPNRNDFTESSPNSRPTHETLYDAELGYKRNSRSYAFGANLYYMQYQNQLVPTGQLNDVGAATRINVPESFRRGIEMEFGWQLAPQLEWIGNATFSQNKVVAFTEYIDNWDTGEQETVAHENTDLALSPSVIAASDLSFTFWNREETPSKAGHNASVALVSKYVGDQYIDNTSDDAAKLDAYFVNDVRLRYRLSNSFVRGIDFNLTMRNALDEQYEANAWVYRYRTGGNTFLLDGYFPQAGRHFLAGITIDF